MLVLWDVDGNEIREELPPPTYKDLLQDQKAPPLHRLAGGRNCIIDATLENGKHCIIKVLNENSVLDQYDQHNANVLRDMLKRECALMRWVSSTTNIPIPGVLYYNGGPSFPYIIMEKCTGTVITNAFGALPLEAKIANMRSFARIAVELFHLQAPEGIGSIAPYLPSAAWPPSLGPLVLPRVESPPQELHSITEYFSWLIEAKLRSLDIRDGDTETDHDEAKSTLKNLEVLISKTISNFDAALLKSVLCHEDLTPHNILINNEGNVTGIIDWEFHTVKPAVLAAGYPSWIATIDPSTVDRESQWTPFAFVSASESERLYQVYDEIVKEMDGMYYRALKLGRICRSAESLLRQNVGWKPIKAWLETL
ncbi:kinase-like domain-containing protein [Gymnopilus junonius]|uniref:Kinase-like domain-containing protein n=1 Tax=Gymnopilus junonius TaxID=109634 RepID=A0A9P5NEV9_GYMJU|nr:kinase-like domain-containing protein [Gymnopilus junonius]